MCKSCRSRRVCERDTGTRNEVRVVTGLDHETASGSCVTPIHIRQNSSEVLHVSSSSIGLALPPMCTSPKTSRELLEVEKLSGTRFSLQLIRCLMLRPWQPGLPTVCVLFVSSERDCRHALPQEHVISALVPSSVSTPQDRRLKDPTPSLFVPLRPQVGMSLSRCGGALTFSPLPTCIGATRTCRNHDDFSPFHAVPRHGKCVASCGVSRPASHHQQTCLLAFCRRRTPNGASHNDAPSRAEEVSVASL